MSQIKMIIVRNPGYWSGLFFGGKVGGYFAGKLFGANLGAVFGPVGSILSGIVGYYGVDYILSNYCFDSGGDQKGQKDEL